MAAISEKRIFKLLGTLYDAAKDGSSDFWTPIYTELADILNSGPGSLSLFLTKEKKFKVLATNARPEMFDEYDNYYQKVSPFRNTIIGLKAGEYFSRRKHCTDEAFEKTEIFQDYFRKHDIFQYEYHVLYKSPEITGGISFSRPKSRPELSKDQRRALNFMLPHLQRVFQFHLTVTNAKREASQMSEALGRMHQSVIVVDKDSRIVYLNTAAQRIADKSDGLSIERGKTLIANSPAANQALRKMLSSLFEPSQTNGHRRTMQLPRSSGLRPLQLEVFPFSEQDFKSYEHEPLALVFVYDPEQRMESPEEGLIHAYGLTPAEARVAALLAKGNTVQEACEILKVKPNTVRTQLTHVFSKTHTNRQSDLIRLVLSGPGKIAN